MSLPLSKLVVNIPHNLSAHKCLLQVHQLIVASQCQASTFANRDRVAYRHSSSQASTERERVKNISAYYNIPAVDNAACKVSYKLSWVSSPIPIPDPRAEGLCYIAIAASACCSAAAQKLPSCCYTIGRWLTKLL